MSEDAGMRSARSSLAIARPDALVSLSRSSEDGSAMRIFYR